MTQLQAQQAALVALARRSQDSVFHAGSQVWVPIETVAGLAPDGSKKKQRTWQRGVVEVRCCCAWLVAGWLMSLALQLCSLALRVLDAQAGRPLEAWPLPEGRRRCASSPAASCCWVC